VKKIKVTKVANKKPASSGEGPKSVKKHNAGKVSAPKPVKAKNMPSNYGVKK
jgi:hypothetical protein